MEAHETLRVQGNIAAVAPELASLFALPADTSQLGELDEVPAVVKPDLLKAGRADGGGNISLGRNTRCLSASSW